MTSCCPPPRTRWSGAIGAIARGKRVSIACGRASRSVPVLRWICGVKPTPKAVNKPLHHFIVHGLAKPGALATVSAKHVFQVCMVTPTGTLKTNTAVARGKLLALIARQPPALIFMEACGGAHDWARRFGAMGHEVRLLAPQYVTPFRRGQKNDPNDALALTEAGQRPHIPTVPIKTIEQQDLQALHRVRERLVKNRTAVVN